VRGVLREATPVENPDNPDRWGQTDEGGYVTWRIALVSHLPVTSKRPSARAARKARCAASRLFLRSRDLLARRNASCGSPFIRHSFPASNSHPAAFMILTRMEMSQPQSGYSALSSAAFTQACQIITVNPPGKKHIGKGCVRPGHCVRLTL
jgi:hypothetical protein